MKNLLVLASAVSFAALASGANAADTANASLTLTGTVSPTLSIISASTVANASTAVNDNGGTSATSRLINLSGFAPGGVTASFDGTTTFSISTNAVFTAKVYGTTGHLTNSTGDTVAYKVALEGDSPVLPLTAAPAAPGAQFKVYQVPAGGSTATVNVRYTVDQGQKKSEFIAPFRWPVLGYN